MKSNVHFLLAWHIKVAYQLNIYPSFQHRLKAAAHLLSLGVHAKVEVAAGQADPVLRCRVFVVRRQLLELLQRAFVVPEVEGAVADPLVSQLVGVPAVPLKL